MGLIQVSRAEVSRERKLTAFEELMVGEMFSHKSEIMLKIDNKIAFSFSSMGVYSHEGISHDVTRLAATILWEVEYEYYR